MLSWFVPHLQVQRVQELDLARVRSLGLDALLLDVDNTLEDWPAKGFREATRAWLEALRGGGIRLCFLSNGRGPRIAELAKAVDLPYIARALKPLPRGCRQAIRTLGLDPKRTAVIGDQIFADVLAGRLAGLFTILVRPTSSHEPWFTRVKRPFERFVLRWIRTTA